MIEFFSAHHRLVSLLGVLFIMTGVELGAASSSAVLGIRVIQPGDPRVAQVLQAAFGGSQSAVLGDALPITALLENASGTAAVFYSLKWSAHDAQGKVISTISSQMSGPFDATGKDALLAGGLRIVAPGLALPANPGAGPVKGQFRAGASGGASAFMRRRRRTPRICTTG